MGNGCCSWLLLLAFLPLAAFSASPEQTQLAELLEKRDEIGAQMRQAGATYPTPELVETNRKAAELTRKLLLEQGYKLGEIEKSSVYPEIFSFEMEAGPLHSRAGAAIRKAKARFGISYQVQVGGLNFGQYNHLNKTVSLGPSIALLPPGEPSGTFLHETTHAFLYSKIDKDIGEPLNMSVESTRKRNVTEIEQYLRYFNFQELATHEKDFHLVRSGIPSGFEMKGMTAAEVAIMKAEKALEFSHRIAFYSGLASEALRRRPVEWREYKSEKLGRVLEIPLKDPADGRVYWKLRMHLNEPAGDAAPAEIERAALDLLDRSKSQAEEAAVRLGKGLENFRAAPVVRDNPRYPRTGCKGYFRFIGGP